MLIDAKPEPASPFDIICLGRLAVDLYGEQIDTPLEETRSFRRYVGGSSANLAVGCARQGLKTALISGVGNDAMGRYLLKQLADDGVDISGIKVDPVRRTPLAFLGMQGAEAIGLDFYRHDPADLGLSAADISPTMFRNAKVLSLTATHLSDEGAAEAISHAVDVARNAGLTIVLDLDYRAPLWPLHRGGLAGMIRAVAELAAVADVVVGNEEEFEIVGGVAIDRQVDRFSGPRALRAQSDAVLICKLGPHGAVAFDGAVPAGVGEPDIVASFPVQVVNPVGAGDAFLAGYLKGRIAGLDSRAALRRGNAAGALVVSRHGCSDAMPSGRELELFEALGRPREPAISHAHRVARRRRRTAPLTALAFDHREPFRHLMREAGRGAADVRRFKQLLGQVAIDVATAHALQGPGVLVDDTFGRSLLAAFTARNWFVARPVEETGSRPLRFEAEDNLEAAVAAWHPAQVAKCLVWYHPDDPADLKTRQIDQLKRLSAAAERGDREWILEVIPPRDMDRSDATLLRAVGQLCAVGLKPDYWKLPAFAEESSWNALSELIARHDPDCRGSLMLGLDQPLEALKAGMEIAAQQPACAGFAIGRSVFMHAAREWFAGAMGDEQALTDMRARFDAAVVIWRQGSGPAPESRESFDR